MAVYINGPSFSPWVVPGIIIFSHVCFNKLMKWCRKCIILCISLWLIIWGWWRISLTLPMWIPWDFMDYSLTWGLAESQRITNRGIWPVNNQIYQSRVTKNPCSSPTNIGHDPMRPMRDYSLSLEGNSLGAAPGWEILQLAWCLPTGACRPVFCGISERAKAAPGWNLRATRI